MLMDAPSPIPRCTILIVYECNLDFFTSGPPTFASFYTFQLPRGVVDDQQYDDTINDSISLQAIICTKAT